MTPLALFLAWRRARRLNRIATTAERRRSVIIEQKATKRQKHQAHRYLDGDLRRATHTALAAEVGREWAL